MEHRLTPEAQAVRGRLTAAHPEELRSMEPTLRHALALGRAEAAGADGPA